MKKVYRISRKFYESDLEVGKAYILVEREYLDGGSRWELRPDNGEGIPGNVDSSIRRYHRWRGTTGNVATYAYGLRTVQEIRKTKEEALGNLIITVVLGPDLMPEDS